MIAHAMNARALWFTASCLVCMLAGWLALPVQNPSLEQQIAEIRAVESENHKALAEYSWQEQETITVKGKVERQRSFEVQLEPDGRLRRTALDLPEGNFSQTEKEGGMHEWATQKKKRALMIYAQEVKELAETYVHFDTGSLQRAYEQGDIASEPATGTSVKKLSVRNYLKPGDLVTMAFSQQDKIQSLEVSSYLTDLKEPIHILAEFVNARDGLNHVDVATATAPKKGFSIVIRKLAYERTAPHVRR
jgi:hypothetical protein